MIKNKTINRRDFLAAASLLPAFAWTDDFAKTKSKADEKPAITALNVREVNSPIFPFWNMPTAKFRGGQICLTRSKNSLTGTFMYQKRPAPAMNSTTNGLKNMLFNQLKS